MKHCEFTYLYNLWVNFKSKVIIVIYMIMKYKSDLMTSTWIGLEAQIAQIID